MRRALAWGVVLACTAAVAATSTSRALERYRAFGSGWAWDLAYYNQWYWAITRGDGTISVRPLASYADEGPSVWKTNYLAPIRYAIIPIYAASPGPETLLVLHNAVFWLLLPAAFGLVLGETGSIAAGLAALGLVLTTPLLRPLAANDFRELQLALPFALAAVGGIRARSVAVAAVGVLGLLACRQEYALLVASLALVPPRRPEGIERRHRWASALLFSGLGWFLVGFLGFLRASAGSMAPAHYLGEFGGPRPGALAILGTALDLLLIGMGAWVLLAGLAPRVALLALPWLWSVAAGRWSLQLIQTEQWHHVRYTAPLAATVLAAGLVGFGRFWTLARRLRVGGAAVAAAWLAAMLLMGLAGSVLDARLARVPAVVRPAEARALWRWIGRVGPDDGVLAAYEVSAPLSSRRLLFSYVLEPNRPKGYPDALPDAIRWVFLRDGDLDPAILARQGFARVHGGPRFSVFRRAGAPPRTPGGADAEADPPISRIHTD
jgi:hypothetical protein